MSTAQRTQLNVELNGVNQIAEVERKGTPRDMFWPWFAANISVFSISYGSFVLGFGISFSEAAIAVILGVAISNLFCGVIAISGKRASAPTMTVSRSIFGIRGNRFPSVLSWLLTLGWETVLTAIAVLATSTILQHLGWADKAATKTVALVVVVGLIAFGGLLGFDLIMRMQRWVTWIAGFLTAFYMTLAWKRLDLAALGQLPAGDAPALLGAVLFTMTGFGLGWVNAAADYSRYLPRSASGSGVLWWTTFGASLGPVVLLLFGLLVSGSSKTLSDAIAVDPVGALTTILPTWFLLPFAVVTVLGLVGGAVMDIYSSGLSLLNAGLRAPRWVATGIDATLMVAGAVYLVFFAADFIGPFQGFLITLGVPVAAWCGIFLGDIALRRTDYAEAELFDPNGRYGDVRWMPITLVLSATVVGWGLVTNNAATFLGWQGYLLAPLGLGGSRGPWASANLGVVVALAMGFLGYVALGRGAVRAQESLREEAASSRPNERALELAAELRSLTRGRKGTPSEELQREGRNER
jgi:NCS1 family nucleobase:cation symporter-1